MRRVLTTAELGQRIKSARIARGFAHHADLSEALGRDEHGSRVALSTISKWENGLSRPEKLLFRLAEALQVPVEYLMYAEEADAEDPRAQAAAALAAVGISADEAAPLLERLARMEARDVQEILGAFKPRRKRVATPVPAAYSGVHSLAPPPVPDRVPAAKRRHLRAK